MHLVDMKEIKDERTLPGRARAAMEVYAPRANDLSSVAPIRVRKGQHLDVDGILARSLPSLGVFSVPDVKTTVLR